MVNLRKACVTGMMTEAGGRVASGLSANIAVGFDCIGVSRLMACKVSKLSLFHLTSLSFQTFCNECCTS